jgi:hypothetical protein
LAVGFLHVRLPANHPPGTCHPSWLPVLIGLTPHAPRHGHQTWMEDRIADVLKSERMGHEVPCMRGVYSHVSTAMRAGLTAAL